MAYPPGIQTVTLRLGSTFDSAGTLASIVGNVVPLFGLGADRLVWNDTGQTYAKVSTPLTWDDTEKVAYATVPHPTQAGWRDQTQATFTGWSYRIAAVAAYADGQRQAFERTITPLPDDTVIDVDLLPNGAAATPTVTAEWELARADAVAALSATEVEQVTLTGNLAYTLPAGVGPNRTHSVVFTQDGTGGHTVTYDGQPVTVDLPAGASTLVEIWPGGEASPVGEEGLGVAVRSPGNPLYVATETARIAPTLHPITEHIDYYRNVLIVDGSSVYAIWSITGGAFEWHKSTDGGHTWTVKGSIPGDCQQAIKLTSGTILAVQITATSNSIWRSTDDGATWSTISGALLTGPLTSAGISEGTDGSVMIAEYTTVTQNTSRVRRSTDDGLTWATALEVPLHHMHSIVYDHVAGRHVVFADDTTGPQIPQIWASVDGTGASWVKIGDVTGIDQPNFVTPMFFANYIAWGSDNQVNGRISRISRADFYAGNFDQCEQVAILSRRAAYGTFPLREDVWAVALNGEHIASSPDIQPEGPGSTMCDVWLVSADGSLVSGGMESVRFLTQPGVLSGVRPWFPSRMRGVVDHKGMLWVNMPVGPLRSYAAVLATQGWDSGAHRLDHMARSVILDQRVPLLTMRGDAPADGYVRFIEPYPNYVIVQNDITSSATRSSVQYNNDGTVEYRSAGAMVAKMSAGVWYFDKRMDMASNAIGIRAGSGSPESVVTAPVSTLYMNWSGQPSLWYKHSGSAATGWRPLTPAQDTTANLSSAAAAINTVGKYEGRQVFDTTANRPVWALGALATDVWAYADGTTAVTPA